MSGDQALKAEGMVVRYGHRPVLHDLSFELSRNGFLGIIGPNGSGKTTLLRAVSGAIPLGGGRVEVAGRQITRIKPRRLSRILAFVPQSLSIPVAFTVRELVAMGRIPYLSGWSRFSSRDREVVEEVMRRMDVTSLASRAVNELSAGEQQRALVAMALAQEPEILLLDEPTAYLDIQHAWKLMELICELNTSGRVAVLITLHDLALAAEFCGQLLLLEKGTIASSGPAAAVLQSEILSRVYAHPIQVRKTEDDRMLILPQRTRLDSSS